MRRPQTLCAASTMMVTGVAFEWFMARVEED
jgi:hypothetical protein